MVDLVGGAGAAGNGEEEGALSGRRQSTRIRERSDYIRCDGESEGKRGQSEGRCDDVEEDEADPDLPDSLAGFGPTRLLKK
eukprot:3283702-Pleurochrysis_carterae.AAC.1